MAQLDVLIDLMKTAAAELLTMNTSGGLHIFVSDGNCDDDDIEFCMRQNLTEAERDFTYRMLSEFTDSQRHGVYAFSEAMRHDKVIASR